MAISRVGKDLYKMLIKVDTNEICPIMLDLSLSSLNDNNDNNNNNNNVVQPYTKKQWDKFPAQLDAEVFTRLPYREDNDDRSEANGRRNWIHDCLFVI